MGVETRERAEKKKYRFGGGQRGWMEFAVEATLVPEAPNGHHREVVCEGKVRVKSPRMTGGRVGGLGEMRVWPM